MAKLKLSYKIAYQHIVVCLKVRRFWILMRTFPTMCIIIQCNTLHSVLLIHQTIPRVYTNDTLVEFTFSYKVPNRVHAMH